MIVAHYFLLLTRVYDEKFSLATTSESNRKIQKAIVFHKRNRSQQPRNRDVSKDTMEYSTHEFIKFCRLNLEVE